MFRNLPNLFTATRLALVPWIARAVLGGQFRAALALTLIAGLTDAVDGYLARRFAWTSRIGAWLDPVADKVLLVTLFVVLGWTGAMPWWLVALVFARDVAILAMVAGALAFTSIRDFPPSVWGKVSTIVQVSACLGVMVGPPVRLVAVLVWATAAATTWSGVDYVRIGVSRFRAESIASG